LFLHLACISNATGIAQPFVEIKDNNKDGAVSRTLEGGDRWTHEDGPDGPVRHWLVNFVEQC